MQQRIVVIGGGTGSSIVLAALRRLGVKPTAIVPTSDSGGSSGRLRQELGIIPVGDIRQCVLALGDFTEAQRALWNTRFTTGKLNGHALGNLILAGLLESSRSVDKALECARKIWDLKGSIIPMTSCPTTLCALYRDGTRVCDEHRIDEPKKLHGGIARVWLLGKTAAYPAARKALEKAQQVILACGDLYTSTIPILLPAGMRQALAKSHARIILVANLITKYGQTDGFTVSRLVLEVNRYLAPSAIDVVLVNSAPIPKRLLRRYSTLGERPILLDADRVTPKSTRLVFAPMLDTAPLRPRVAGDVLRRSAIRHDPKKLARALKILLRE